MTSFALYFDFTQKVVATTITRPATLKKTNFLPIKVDMTIFA